MVDPINNPDLDFPTHLVILISQTSLYGGLIVHLDRMVGTSRGFESHSAWLIIETMFVFYTVIFRNN